MLRFTAGCLFAVMLMGHTGCEPTTQPAKPEEPNGDATQPQSKEPAVTLQVGDRAAFDALLNKKRGAVVLVDFWATWCAPCQKAFPHTVELYQKLHGRGLDVIAVSCDDAEAHETALTFLKKQHATFDNLRLKGGPSGDAFDSFELPGGLPHYSLYDRQGKLRYQFSVDPAAKKQFTHEDIQQRVEQLLAEKAE